MTGQREPARLVPARAVVQALGRPVTRRLVVTDAGVERGGPGHPAEHAEETLVVVCVAGAGWVEADGRRFLLGARAAAVLGPGRQGLQSSAARPWTAWWIRVRGGDVPELVAATGATRAAPVVSLPNADRAARLVEQLHARLAADPSEASLVACAGVAWNLLTLVATDRGASARLDPVTRAQAYLADRLDRRVSSTELATATGFSRSRLATLFTQATGTGPIAYHTMLRLERGRQLLESSNASVREVAVEIGYHDPFYFSRLFRQRYRLSPSAYRAAAREREAPAGAGRAERQPGA